MEFYNLLMSFNRSFYFLIILLSLFYQSHTVQSFIFQKYTYSNVNPSIVFEAKQNSLLQFKAQIFGGNVINTTMIILSNSDPDIDQMKGTEFARFSNITSKSINLTNGGFYKIIYKVQQTVGLAWIRISASLNGITVKEFYEAFKKNSTFKIVYHKISVSSNCRAVIKHLGQYYGPGNDPLNGVPHQNHSFEKNFTKGIWHIGTTIPITNTTNQLNTSMQQFVAYSFPDSPCSNPCMFEQGQVAFLAPETTDICVCYQKSWQNLVWNNIHRQCEICGSDGCQTYQNSKQIPFQKFSFNLFYPTLQFWATAGQAVQLKTQILGGFIQDCQFKIIHQKLGDFYNQKNDTSSYTLIAPKTGAYFFYYVHFRTQGIVQFKLSLVVNGKTVKEYYQTVSRSIANDIKTWKTFIQVSTNVACKARIYWDALYQQELRKKYQIKLYSPGSNIEAGLPSPKMFKFLQSYDILLSPGNWILQFANLTVTQNYLKINTFTDQPCFNPCMYQKEEGVNSLLYGSTDTCACFVSSPQHILWNHSQRRCEICQNSTCQPTTKETEIPYQNIRQADAKLLFYARANKNITVTGQMIQYTGSFLSTTTIFYYNKSNYYMPIVQNQHLDRAGKRSYNFISPEQAVYYFDFWTNSRQNYMIPRKLSAFIGSVKIKESFLTGHIQTGLFNISTTVPCKIKLYYNKGDFIGSALISPNSSYLDRFRAMSGKHSIYFLTLYPGQWVLSTSSSKMNLIVNTFSDAKCQSACQYKQNGQQFLAIQPNICSCNTNFQENRVWSQINNRCQLCDTGICSSVDADVDVCGNGIRAQNQECDAGGDQGCQDCKILPGYTCMHNLYSKSLCFTVCGDCILGGTEICDNKNKSGCQNCRPTPGFSCTGNVGSISQCSITCGDGVRAITEKCDNGNNTGCSVNCVPDKGYVCNSIIGATSTCNSVCGDGVRVDNEACDNGKKIGCLSCNQFDYGYNCMGFIGQISRCMTICGDGIRTVNQQCDNRNQLGCSRNCFVELGYVCQGLIGQSSICRTVCGDKIKAGSEECDNGEKEGCQNCRVESGYLCKLGSNQRISVCEKI